MRAAHLREHPLISSLDLPKLLSFLYENPGARGCRWQIRARTCGRTVQGRRRRGRTLSTSDAGTRGLCLGDVKPWKAFLGKVLFSRRLKLRGLIERTDMKMRFRRSGETFASQS